ncbi:MAG: hypothetical protein GDA54_02095 [Alphaproteobacteria bacterium GM7ARS4]|nr:hypothetical protein [Alphaproteobacteria bacterium GM7ARS4]
MLTWAQDVMTAYGIDVILFDEQSAAMIGGIDAIACRLMVMGCDYDKAWRALRWEAWRQGMALEMLGQASHK